MKNLFHDVHTDQAQSSPAGARIHSQHKHFATQDLMFCIHNEACEISLGGVPLISRKTGAFNAEKVFRWDIDGVEKNVVEYNSYVQNEHR
ncbi:Protein of unknown function [Gryllus bimaculatus]|nr:Protein of unknown function [Gryllus bimaculatus]